jgi:FKBP-type peptidyl-prolyl cis-trans isomerase FkpA
MTMNRKTFLSSTLSLLTFGAFMTDATAATTETLPSGVKIIHTQVGTGANPTAADTVKVHYRGTLADGKEFDSSYKRNAPISFPLRGVITAWTQGVQKMKVGGKATLICPPDTAYGARGVPGVIPPGATLTFDIELLAIEK